MSYDFYRTYIALKLHFYTDAYDIVKYQGKVKRFIKAPKISTYLTHFCKKYKKSDLIEYLVSNFIAGDRNGGLFSHDGEDVYMKWRERTQNLTYNFTRDINTIKNQLKDKNITSLFESSDQHPLILKLYLGRHIMLETVVILNIIFDFIVKIDANISKDYMWDNFKRLVSKYQPFLHITKEKYEVIIESKFTN